MATCEKCWSDANRDVAILGVELVERYGEFLFERKDSPCSPEEQCGEIHCIIHWSDGTVHCVCGEKSDDL